MNKTNIDELDFNPYQMFGKSWALLSAGSNIDNCNTMTISWGSMGSLWGHGSTRPVVNVYVRPSRYTKKFMEENEYFSLSFFAEKYKDDLAYLGSHSGKEENKIAKTKLHLVQDKAVYFKEAKLVFICKKIYGQDINEQSFVDKKIMNDVYPLMDFHKLYVGEIVEIYQQ